jgi:hypothetical protein
MLTHLRQRLPEVKLRVSGICLRGGRMLRVSSIVDEVATQFLLLLLSPSITATVLATEAMPMTAAIVTIVVAAVAAALYGLPINHSSRLSLLPPNTLLL